MRSMSSRHSRHSHRGRRETAAEPLGAPVPDAEPAGYYDEPAEYAGMTSQAEPVGPAGYDDAPGYDGPAGCDDAPRHAGPAGHNDVPEPPAHRHRKAWLVAFVLPVSVLLAVVATLTGLHMTGRGTIHVTADTGRQAQQHTVTPLDTSPSCCVSSAIGSAGPGMASPSSHRQHAAKKNVSTSQTGGTTAAPGDMPGWRLVYSTNFPGSSLPSGWDAYTGEPGGDPYGNWTPGNVSVSGGALHLTATSSAQGGVAFYGNPQTYGMYLVRMKGDYEPGLSINNLAILWPAEQGVWPPEIDFFQDLGGTRQIFSASLHAGPDGNGSCCVVASPNQSSNGTEWHTYGVEWTPTAITYTIDGRAWASVQRSSLGSPAQWPTIPMNLTLQSQNQASAQPNSPIETMTVDWVAEYAMNG
jgi:hypothetical protein